MSVENIQRLFITYTNQLGDVINNALLHSNSLLKHLETVLELIDVPFKHKIANIFLQELFNKRITICLIEQSSLDIVFCGIADLLLSGNVPSALNLMIAYCTAVLEQHSLATMSLFVYPSQC